VTEPFEIPHDWTFKNLAVAENFDRHVREQLPWYELTTGVIAHVARHYIPEGGMVYDIGASTGNVGRAIADTLKARGATLEAIDNSPQMADLYAGPGVLHICDATDFDFQPFDLAVCFLTLMFVQPAKRGAFLSMLRERCRPGGAIVIFDRTVPGSGYSATVLWRLALAGKVAAGADPKDVIAKELSLSGVQRPIDPKELPGGVEVFRFGDFAGWIIEAA
jgi:tRNA (cmo5U34)-methyltransferase